MKDFDYFKKDLNTEELDFVEKGKEYWKNKILLNVKTKQVTREELNFLIDCVIENSFSNAKEFFNFEVDNNEKGLIL